jgi:hypothetical protein
MIDVTFRNRDGFEYRSAFGISGRFVNHVQALEIAQILYPDETPVEVMVISLTKE